MKTVIKIENLYKEYHLGVISHGTLYRDIQSWWARYQGKPDPNSIIWQNDHNNRPDKNILALKDINLELKEGEVLGIIGKNGAGKSTLLKIISRVTAPSKGVIKIKGRIASLLEVGTGFHPELTGRENIYLNGVINGMSRKEISLKFDEIVEFSGVEKFIDTPVKRYSSGMHVRLGFAVAAYIEPDILVVDEVLAVGDANFQNKCLNKMNKLSENGRTVLFVSHNLASIKKLCTKVVLLENGEIKKVGEPIETVKYYLQSISNNNTSTSEIVDLKDYKNRQGTGEIHFEWAMLQGSNNEPRNTFSIGEDLKLIFDIEANGRKNNFSLNVLIRSSDGTAICKIFDQVCEF